MAASESLIALIVSKVQETIKANGEKSQPPSLKPIGSKKILSVVYPLMTAKNVWHQFILFLLISGLGLFFSNMYLLASDELLPNKASDSSAGYFNDENRPKLYFYDSLIDSTGTSALMPLL